MSKKINYKAQKTIERMKRARQQDSICLRQIIEEKLKWVLSEQAKLKEIMNQLEKQLDRYNELMLKLKGAELALMDVLGRERDKVWQTDLQESEPTNF